MPVDNWAPKIKTNMQAVHTAAQAAAEIPEEGEVYGYNEWPAELFTFPSTLIGTLGGTQDYGEGQPAIAHHNVRIWSYFNAGLSLSEAQAMAWPFVERVRNQFAQDMSLDNTANGLMVPPPFPALFYEGPGILTYNNKPYAGIIFSYTLKENESGTFPVQA
jgi:hypothetical protein